MEAVDYDEELFRDGQIMTYTGKYFDPINPDPALIDIRDIAHALSQQPRYGGHLPQFYSVGQHSLHVARRLPKELQLVGLLHDATEAYMCDIPSPVKSRLPEYKAHEKKLLEAIMRKFNVWEVYYAEKDYVKTIDTVALKTEWDVIMKGRSNVDPYFAGPGVDMARVSILFIEKFLLYREHCPAKDVPLEIEIVTKP
jgi:hypothetical protein